MFDYLSCKEAHKMWLLMFRDYYPNKHDSVPKYYNPTAYLETIKSKSDKLLSKYFRKFFIENKRYRPLRKSDFECQIDKTIMGFLNKSNKDSVVVLGSKDDKHLSMIKSKQELESFDSVKILYSAKKDNKAKFSMYILCKREIINISNKSADESIELILKKALQVFNKFYLPNY